MAQVVSRRLPTAQAMTNPSVVHVGFVVDQVTMGQVFLLVLPFPLQTSFHQSSVRIHLPPMFYCVILTADCQWMHTVCVLHHDGAVTVRTYLQR